MPDIPRTSKCAARHLGLWAVEPQWFQGAVASVRAGTWPVLDLAQEPRGDEPSFTVTKDGVAIIQIEGFMMKGDSKFGGTNTLAVRSAIRETANSREVGGILVHVDSPGGTAAGTGELADDIAEAASRKPVVAFTEGMMASAAMFASAHATAILASRSSEIGSIGTYMLAFDETESLDMQGVKAHLISSGPHKGDFAAGMPITKPMLKEGQRRVDALAADFFDAVSRGRSLSGDALDAVTDGRIHIASEAKKLGLIDGIATFDSAYDSLVAQIGAEKKRKRRAVAIGRSLDIAAKCATLKK